MALKSLGADAILPAKGAVAVLAKTPEVANGDLRRALGDSTALLLPPLLAATAARSAALFCCSSAEDLLLHASAASVCTRTPLAPDEVRAIVRAAAAATRAPVNGPCSISDWLLPMSLPFSCCSCCPPAR